jgi:hypothetical protein
LVDPRVFIRLQARNGNSARSGPAADAERLALPLWIVALTYASNPAKPPTIAP